MVINKKRGRSDTAEIMGRVTPTLAGAEEISLVLLRTASRTVLNWIQRFLGLFPLCFLLSLDLEVMSEPVCGRQTGFCPRRDVPAELSAQMLNFSIFLWLQPASPVSSPLPSLFHPFSSFLLTPISTVLHPGRRDNGEEEMVETEDIKKSPGMSCPFSALPWHLSSVSSGDKVGGAYHTSPQPVPSLSS